VASLQARHPVLDAFLTGVLAVAVASPCTAPFMGASLGLAVSLPAVQALAVFAITGLGLALPYLAASLVPAVARALPRPGAWMQTFRRLMAFPMFATVVWLVWVLGQQTGIDGAGALLTLLVSGAFVVWALTLNGRARLVFATLSIAGFALLTMGIGQNIVKFSDSTPVSGSTERWQPWATGKVDSLLASGQPVFVDFLKVAIADRIATIPAHRPQDHITLEMAPLEIRHRSVRPISAKHAQASRFLQQSPIEQGNQTPLAGGGYLPEQRCHHAARGNATR
jgi:thiol:disulfide interchange protein